MNTTSLVVQPFAWLQGRMATLLTFGRTLGFCSRCERYTPWEDEHLCYRCSNCGSDPVEHAAQS